MTLRHDLSSFPTPVLMQNTVLEYTSSTSTCSPRLEAHSTASLRADSE